MVKKVREYDNENFKIDSVQMRTSDKKSSGLKRVLFLEFAAPVQQIGSPHPEDTVYLQIM